MTNSKTKAVNITRKNSLLRSILRALIMSSIMSFAMTCLNVYLQCQGNSTCFQRISLTVWPRSFLVSFALTVPIALMVSPFVAGVADKVVAPS